MTHHGGCWCGAVRYESDSLGPFGHCHCRTCQRIHAAAFATTMRVPRADFRWTKGETLVRRIETTPGKNRWFCPACGSHLVAEWPVQDKVILRIASLDHPPSGASAHIWTSDQAAFFAFDDGLPRFPEGMTKP
jgi:hypothetical protein